METGILAEEIAVLFRVHTDARAVVEALIDEKIPFQMREHLPNLYNHFIAKILWHISGWQWGSVSAKISCRS